MLRRYWLSSRVICWTQFSRSSPLTSITSHRFRAFSDCESTSRLAAPSLSSNDDSEIATNLGKSDIESGSTSTHSRLDDVLDETLRNLHNLPDEVEPDVLSDEDGPTRPSRDLEELLSVQDVSEDSTTGFQGTIDDILDPKLEHSENAFENDVTAVGLSGESDTTGLPQEDLEHPLVGPDASINLCEERDRKVSLFDSLSHNVIPSKPMQHTMEHGDPADEQSLSAVSTESDCAEERGKRISLVESLNHNISPPKPHLEGIQSFYTRLIRSLSPKQYLRLAKRLHSFNTAGRKPNPQAFIKHALVSCGDLAPSFEDSFRRFVHEMKLTDLEYVKSCMEKNEIYRAFILNPEIEAKDPSHEDIRGFLLRWASQYPRTTDSSSLGHVFLNVHDAVPYFRPRDRFAHKVFIHNLPLDIDECKLLAELSRFGRIVATEIFKERMSPSLMPTSFAVPSLPSAAEPSEANAADSITSDTHQESVEVVPSSECDAHADDVLDEALHEDNELLAVAGHLDDSVENVSNDLDQSSDEHMMVEADAPNEVDSENTDGFDIFSMARPRAPLRHMKRPRVVPDSRIYAAVYFSNPESAERALASEARLFGLAMRDSLTVSPSGNPITRLCRTTAPWRVLYVGNLPFNIQGYEVEDLLHDVLRSRHSGFQGLQGCIQTNEFNIGKGSILVEFDSHATAQLAQQILGDRRMNGRPLRVGWQSREDLSKIEARKRRKNRLKDFIPWH